MLHEDAIFSSIYYQREYQSNKQNEIYNLIHTWSKFDLHLLNQKNYQQINSVEESAKNLLSFKIRRKPDFHTAISLQGRIQRKTSVAMK